MFHFPIAYIVWLMQKPLGEMLPILMLVSISNTIINIKFTAMVNR